MKQELKNKLIFVAGSVFGLMILGALIQVVGAQQYQWAPPTDSFPNANTGIPIDTGSSNQSKEGRISFPSEYRDTVLVGNNSWIGNVDNTSRIIFGVGSSKDIVKIYGAGLSLPVGSTGASSETEGLLRYNVGGKKVQFNDGTAWKDVGTGSGGGDSYWSMQSGTLTYGGGNVKITNVTQGTQTGFWNTGTIGANHKNTFALVRTAQADVIGEVLACDTNRFYKQCPQGTGAFYGGGLKDGSAPTAGMTGIDEFADCPSWNGLSGELYVFGTNAECRYYHEELLQHTGFPTYRSMNYVYETRNVGSPTDTATLSVGNISVGGTITSAKVKVADLEYGESKTVSRSNLGIGIHDLGVKGIVTSFTVNTGGGPNEATSFKILDSTEMSSDLGGGAGGFMSGDWYTFFSRNNDVTVGISNIKIFIPPWPGQKQFIDSISIKYIPVQF
jgi:hypothetical protein